MLFNLVEVPVQGALKAFFNRSFITGIVLYEYEHGCDVSFPLPQQRGTITLYLTFKEIHSI